MIYLGESYFYYFQIEMTETYWLIDQKRNSKTYLYDDNNMHREVPNNMTNEDDNEDTTPIILSQKSLPRNLTENENDPTNAMNHGGDPPLFKCSDELSNQATENNEYDNMGNSTRNILKTENISVLVNLDNNCIEPNAKDGLWEKIKFKVFGRKTKVQPNTIEEPLRTYANHDGSGM